MTPPSPPTTPPPHPRRAPRALPLLLLLATLLTPTHAQPIPEPPPPPSNTTPLSSARDILTLPPDQADRKLPARIRGVVTLSARRGDLLFVQDPSAGIYVYFKDNFPPQGSFIEAAGTTAKGLFSPIVAADTLTVLSQTNLPPPNPLAIEDLAFGSHDSQWVEVRGIVTRQQVDWGHLVLNLASGNANLPVRIIDFDPANIPFWIDAEISVRGVAGTSYNNHRQLVGFHLLAQDTTAIQTLRPPPSNPFSLPLRASDSLMAYSPDGNSEHRTRLRGVVTWAWPNLGFFLHDDAGSVRVFPASPTNPAVGDVVDVVGFPAPNLDRPVLREAILQTIGQTNTPPPRIPSPDELANPTTSHVCEGDLITLEGVALNAFEQHQYHASFLVEAHGKTFRIRHLNHWPLPKPDQLVGSRVRVTGICTRPPPESPSSSPDGFSLWMRDANDLAILGASPQRRQRQALWGLGALLAAILLATTHSLTLRRRVRSQTEAIRQREAALEERWLDLFENANDIIYTHDLQGVITSVNNSGQDLLGVPAQQIIGTRIQDWVDPADLPLVHQQIAAKTTGSTPRTAYELRLRTPSGQRLVLEVNSRLILHDGSPSGIQGIARDITDRKEADEALRSSERQLRASLEERDRLGRDLHDGLIQSIYAAGLALDDCSRLLHSDPASAESRLRTITTDLNRVIREVRSFINRIEQDPLSGAEFTSALESLATTTSSPSNPALRIETNVDPSAAHRLHPHQATHLLQITREALANSLRHANPQLISISLQNSRAGIQFEVRDDGRGFDPSLPNPKGRGLRNITTRADRLGAWLHIESAPNQGTRLVLDIPTNSPHDPQPQSQPQS